MREKPTEQTPRNTPACAGKTVEPTALEPNSEKHPRLRGEDFSRVLPAPTLSETPPLARGRLEPSALFAWKVEETPPLARGRPPFGPLFAMHQGNTPACAGKTERGNLSRYGSGKHPRLRGEDQQGVDVAVTCMETPPLARGRPQKLIDAIDKAAETPPLARGRLQFHATGFGCPRNTPACAGKTDTNPNGRFPSRKHPRLRGEDPISRV